MLVAKSKYNALLAELRALKLAYNQVRHERNKAVSLYNDLHDKWNDVVDIINAKGGQEFLDDGILPAQASYPLNDADIRRLLLLCHPDKHDGKQVAVEMTQKLLAMRQQ